MRTLSLRLPLFLMPLLVFQATVSSGQNSEFVPKTGIVLHVERKNWTPLAPAVVSGNNRKLTDGTLDIAVVPALYLQSERGNYWSPVDLLKSVPLSAQKRTVGVSADVVTVAAQPIRLHFSKKGDTIDFRVDARNLLWAKEISSVWPSQKLFAAVDPGSYQLQLVLSADSASQKLPIVVTRKQPGKQ